MSLGRAGCSLCLNLALFPRVTVCKGPAWLLRCQTALFHSVVATHAGISMHSLSARMKPVSRADRLHSLPAEPDWGCVSICPSSGRNLGTAWPAQTHQLLVDHLHEMQGDSHGHALIRGICAVKLAAHSTWYCPSKERIATPEQLETSPGSTC